MRQHLKTGIILLLFFTGLTGLLYPLMVTGLAQVIFPYQANGSLITYDGDLLGSSLIGQAFEAPAYFWSRPSATANHPYNASGSGGSNFGSTNPELEKAVKERIEAIKAFDPQGGGKVPIDLVTASASGLDPHISVSAAMVQVPRVASERGLSQEQVIDLVNRATQGRQFGLLGEPRVNVLVLNLALDGITINQ